MKKIVLIMSSAVFMTGLSTSFAGTCDCSWGTGADSQTLTITNCGYGVLSSCANGINHKTATNVIVGSGVTSIGNGAFHVATNLTSVTLPNTLTRIENNAFAQTGLTNIIIPESVTSIGNSAFMHSKDLTNVTFAGNSKLTTIEQGAFCNTGLTSFTIPKGVTSIGEGGFYNARNLTELIIPDTLTSENVAGWYNNIFALTSIATIICNKNDGTVGGDESVCAKAIERFLPDENGSCQSGIHCLSNVQKIGDTCVGQYFGSTNNDGTCTTKSSCNSSGNYINTDTRQCVTPASCIGMYVADTVNKKCFKMPGCVNYANNACQECDNGYLTNSSGSCTPAADCKNGMHATLYGSCEENPAGCNTFDGNRCTECNSGLLRQGESCVSSCGEGYKLNNGICWRTRYTPAEVAKVVGESNTILLYYK